MSEEKKTVEEVIEIFRKMGKEAGYDFYFDSVDITLKNRMFHIKSIFLKKENKRIKNSVIDIVLDEMTKLGKSVPDAETRYGVGVFEDAIINRINKL